MNGLFEFIRKYGPQMIKATAETLNMVIISMIIGLSVGLIFGCLMFMTRRGGIKENRTVHVLINSYVNIVRSIPFLLFVIFLVPVTRSIVGTGFGTRAASFPLSLIAIALYARLAEQTLLEVNPDMIESAHSMGARPHQILRYVVLVEARPGLVLSFTSVFISLISYSTVMGMVGGGGIGDFAIIYGYQSNNRGIVVFAIIIMIVIVLIVQAAGNRLAKYLDKR